MKTLLKKILNFFTNSDDDSDDPNKIKRDYQRDLKKAHHLKKLKKLQKDQAKSSKLKPDQRKTQNKASNLNVKKGIIIDQEKDDSKKVKSIKNIQNDKKANEKYLETTKQILNQEVPNSKTFQEETTKLKEKEIFKTSKENTKVYPNIEDFNSIKETIQSKDKFQDQNPVKNKEQIQNNIIVQTHNSFFENKTVTNKKINDQESAKRTAPLSNSNSNATTSINNNIYYKNKDVLNPKKEKDTNINQNSSKFKSDIKSKTNDNNLANSKKSFSNNPYSIKRKNNNLETSGHEYNPIIKVSKNKFNTKQNKKDIAILNDLKKTIEKDLVLLKELDYEMYKIELGLNDILNAKEEKEVQKKIQKLEQDLKLIKEKYQKILASNKVKDFEYLEILHIYNSNQEIKETLNNPNYNRKLTKYKDEITDIIKDVEKKHQILQANIKSKDEEIKTKEQALNNVKIQLAETDKFKNEAAKLLKKQQEKMQEIKDKIGKIKVENITKTKLNFDFTKLIAPTLALGLLPTAFPDIYKTRNGKIIQAGVFGLGLYRLGQAFSFKDEVKTEVKFKDYKELLNNMELNVDNLLKEFKTYEGNISQIKGNFLKTYGREIANLRKFKTVLEQLNDLEYLIKKQEQELQKEKEIIYNKEQENMRGQAKYLKKLKDVK